MKKLLSTVHFILIHVRIHWNNLLNRKLALFGPVLFLFFISIPAYSEIRMAIIDTGFCPLKSKKNNVKIEEVVDLTNSVKLDCLKRAKSPARFHGQMVLEEFFKYYIPKKQLLHLYPLVVFNSKGDQKKEYWLKALDWIKKNNIDIVLTAAGLITNQKIVNELPALWFVPSGRMNPQLKDKNALFPQSLAPLDNLFLIGDYYDGRQVLYDQGLLFQDKIDYYFPSGSQNFKGTSRAVAEACAVALNLCPIKNMRGCLLKSSKEYIDNLSQKKIKTY